MSLTERTAAELVRQKLGIRDGSKSAMIIGQIPEALKRTASKLALDPETRDLTLSNPSTLTGAITGGVVDLAALYTANHIIREHFSLGQMYLLPIYAFATSAVDITNDTLTLGAIENVAVGDKVRFTTTGTLPAGLALATDYWVKSWNAGTRKLTLAPTAALATTVNITDVGSGTHTLTVQTTKGEPMQKSSTRSARLPKYLDSTFNYYFIEGNSLFVLPSSRSGSVGFAVPTYPATVANLPTDASAEKVFLDTLASLVAPALAAASGS